MRKIDAKKWKPRIVNAEEVNPRRRLMAAENQKLNTKRRNRNEVARKKFALQLKNLMDDFNGGHVGVLKTVS